MTYQGPERRSGKEYIITEREKSRYEDSFELGSLGYEIVNSSTIEYRAACLRELLSSPEFDRRNQKPRKSAEKLAEFTWNQVIAFNKSPNLKWEDLSTPLQIVFIEEVIQPILTFLYGDQP